MSDSEGKDSIPLDNIIIEDEEQTKNKRRRKPKTSTNEDVTIPIENEENIRRNKRRKRKKKKSKDDIINYGETYLCLENFVSKKKEAKELKGMKKVTKKFYNKQNDIISTYESLLSQNDDSSKEEDKTIKAKIAIWASFLVNIILTVVKLIIAIRSNSLSVVASALDSILDILSGSVLFIIEKIKNRKNIYAYPVGKQRLEPLGVIVFSTMMFTAAIQLIIEGVERLITKDSEIKIDDYTIGILFSTIIIKLLLFIYCQFFVFGNQSVEALAQDHRNDVLSNMCSVVTALIGYYVWWRADPIGGILIGLFIMYTWACTALSTIKKMTGYRAEPDLIKKWTYLCLHFDKRIVAIDTVRGYNIGNGYYLEVDIVLPESMTLKEAHDIGESLQYRLEELEEVERAFVHIDYEYVHKPEHQKLFV